MNGYVHIYTGDGKGKTSAATGLAVRALGAGKTVGIAAFLKTGESAEYAVLKQLDGVTVFPFLPDVTFTFRMTEAQETEAAAFYQSLLQQVANDTPDVLILDEVLDTVNAGLLPESRLLTFLQNRRQPTEIILTGRNPSGALCEAADYITEMVCVRHPFQAGIAARRGIEY